MYPGQNFIGCFLPSFLFIALSVMFKIELHDFLGFLFIFSIFISKFFRRKVIHIIHIDFMDLESSYSLSIISDSGFISITFYGLDSIQEALGDFNSFNGGRKDKKSKEENLFQIITSCKEGIIIFELRIGKRPLIIFLIGSSGGENLFNTLIEILLQLLHNNAAVDIRKSVLVNQKPVSSIPDSELFIVEGFNFYEAPRLVVVRVVVDCDVEIHSCNSFPL